MIRGRCRRWLFRVLGALVLALSIGAAVAAPRLIHRARIGVAYVAKEVCTCVFVAGRELAACRADLAPSADLVRATVLDAPPGVHAWIPGLTERTARHSDGAGCTLE